MLWHIFILMATPLAFFCNAFLGIVELMPSGNRVRHIVSSQDDAVAGLMGRDRPRTRNARHSNAQCTNICISKFPNSSLRKPILLLAAIRLAAHRKYTVRQIRQKTPVAPLCEWKNLRAERLNCQMQMEWWDGAVLNINQTCTKLGSKCHKLFGMHALTRASQSSVE